MIAAPALSKATTSRQPLSRFELTYQAGSSDTCRFCNGAAVGTLAAGALAIG